jgi:hypothetical protein
MPDDLLRKVAERAAAIDTRIQTHCTETIYEKMHGYRFYGKPTMLHLRDLGFLSPRLSIAHGIWMTEPEMEAVAAAGAAASHNPSSNLRLRAGIAPVLAFRAAGIPVALGMDGFAINDDEDMFSEMRLAWRLHGSPPLDSPGLTPTDVLAMGHHRGRPLDGQGQAPRPSRPRLARRSPAHRPETDHQPVGGTAVMLPGPGRNAAAPARRSGGRLSMNLWSSPFPQTMKLWVSTPVEKATRMPDSS